MTTQSTLTSESAGQPSKVKMPRLPLGELGFKYVPAVPVDAGALGDTLVKLTGRLKQREQPLQGLSRIFTIGGSTARAYNFLFGTEAVDEKQAAAHESLRGSLSREPSEIVRILVEALKEPPEERTPGGVRDGDDLTTKALDDPKQWSMSWTTLPEVFASALPQLDEWAATVDVTQPDKATAAFFPTIARYGLSFNLILLKKVQDLRGGNLAGSLRYGLDPGVRYRGESRLVVRHRSTDLRDAATANGRRCSAIHAEHRHRAGAGPGDQGVDARARPRRRRKQRTESLQPSGLDHGLRLGVRPPGGQGVCHRLRRLARSRLSMAHRYRGHGNDDVRQSLREPSGPQAARAAVEFCHSLRQCAAPDLELGGPSYFDRERPTIRGADGSLRQDAPILRRRSDDHAGATLHRRVRLHRPRAMGPVLQRRPAVEHLERDRPLRQHCVDRAFATDREVQRDGELQNWIGDSTRRIAATSVGSRSWIREMP